MRYFSPTSLILSSLCFLVASLPVESSAEPTLRVLTPEDFTPTISHGVWMIEYFSPYCSHCKNFMPTWTQLVEENESNPGINFAQVNCAVNGDLCTSNGIGGYPSMNLYKAGELVEKYNDDRTMAKLTAFVKKHAEVPPRNDEPAAPVNPEGKVEILDSNTFTAALANGPAFVKFYAPWCGHCKKLKPHWDQLGTAMKDKLVIAEVNCEENKSLCNKQDVQGYPVLNFYPGGGAPKTEFTGPRKIENLADFANKAISGGVISIHAGDLDQLVREHDSLFLFLHSHADTRLMKQLGAAAQPLLGSPHIYTSTAIELFERFGLPADSPPVILALKDNVGTAAAAVYNPTSRASPTDLDIPALQTWLLVNRLPTALELNTENFQKVMNAPKTPLVVLVGVAARSKDSTIDQIKEIARKWRESEAKAQLGGEKDVVFVWMDATKWGSWMKSQYGIRQSDLPSVVIVDHKRLIYWNQDLQKEPLKLTTNSVFSGIAGVLGGKIPYKHSQSFIERTASWINDGLSDFDVWVKLHPFKLVLIILGVMVAFFLILRKVFADDFAEPDYRKGNVGKRRLD